MQGIRLCISEGFAFLGLGFQVAAWHFRRPKALGFRVLALREQAINLFRKGHLSLRITGWAVQIHNYLGGLTPVGFTCGRTHSQTPEE